MIVERFKDGNAEAVYRRLHEKGRMMPEGMTYVDSWIESNFERCFQVVECEDVSLIREWMSRWDDLVEFEVIPVVSSEEAERAVNESGGDVDGGSAERDEPE